MFFVLYFYNLNEHWYFVGGSLRNSLRSLLRSLYFYNIIYFSILLNTGRFWVGRYATRFARCFAPRILILFQIFILYLYNLNEHWYFLGGSLRNSLRSLLRSPFYNIILNFFNFCEHWFLVGWVAPQLASLVAALPFATHYVRGSPAQLLAALAIASYV